MEGGSTTSFQKQQSEESKSSQTNPQQRIIALTRDGAVFFKLNEGSLENKTTGQQAVTTNLEIDKSFPSFPTAQVAKYAPLNGNTAVIADELGVHFIDSLSGKEIRLIVRPGVNAIGFSPRDSYVMTCEKFQQGEKNLIIWESKTGKELAEFEWKKTSKEGPKSIKFSPDERFCARQVSKTQIEIYQDGNFTQPKAKINANAETLAKGKKAKELTEEEKKGKSKYWFDGFDIIPQSPEQPQNQFFLAWQHAEGLSDKQDEGGIVYVFDLLNNPEKPKFTVQCSKSQEISVRPSPTGWAVLIWSQNFVDSSGKSYYGEHCVQYIQLVGGKKREFVPVFDGMIHDLVWTPNGEQFIVISGMQPSVSTLYDKNSNPIFEFGKRYRNTIRVCPFSQTVLIGGFGNLAGEVDFWNLDNKKELGKTKAYCSVGVEWAPDGKHIMSAVLYERVKVDNEIRVYSASGKLLCNYCFKDSELYTVQWQPYPQGVFSKPDISKFIVNTSKEESKAEVKPKRLFVPPGGNSVFAQIMKQEMSKTNEKGPKKVDQNQYKDLMKEQAQQHANFLAQNIPSDSPPHKEAWMRKGGQEKETYYEQQPTASQFIIQEEQKPSKHQKRRANKKKKIVVESGGGDYY